MSQPKDAKSVEVVIPVHNSAGTLIPLIESIVNQRGLDIRQIILVDDSSRNETRRTLDSLASQHQSIALVRNSKRLGFTKTANIGLRKTTGPIVFLVNSDVFLGSHSLRTMVDVLLSTDSIGIVGPLSNAGGFQSIPRYEKNLLEKLLRSTPKNATPPPDQILNLDIKLKTRFGPSWVDVPFLNGFCLGLKRDVLESCGLLNEKDFPDGYGEEISYCLEVQARGWRTVLALGAFVGHEGSQSYGIFRRFFLTSRGIRTLKTLYGKSVMRSVFHDANNLPGQIWGALTSEATQNSK